jgi:hypothetical protein
MTLFETTIPKMSYDIQYPRQHAKEFFKYNNYEAQQIISDISEDDGETICSRSLIMLLHQMNERIYELEYEIRQLNRQIE